MATPGEVAAAPFPRVTVRVSELAVGATPTPQSIALNGSKVRSTRYIVRLICGETPDGSAPPPVIRSCVCTVSVAALT
jgi:hypothetical protein